MTAGRAGRLRTTIATPDGKRRYVRALFATIADRYDFITRFLSFGQDRRWKRRLIRLANITPADRVLDLACGTGDILFEASRYNPKRAVGVDVTRRMIQLALANSQRPPAAARAMVKNTQMGVGNWALGVQPIFLVGDMMALPLRAATFDVVTTGYGLRNVPYPHEAVREMHRVLAPGGRLLALDFNRPSNAVVRGAYLAYLTVVGSILGLVLHRDPDTYRYIPESIRNYPGATGIARLLEAHGFSAVRIVPALFGLMTIHVARKI